MKAKEAKMKNLRKQQELIESGMTRISKNSKDGDCSFSYPGALYPEVKKHFEDEGWSVEMVGRNESFFPVWYFSPADAELTPEELEQALKYGDPTSEDNTSDEGDPLVGFLQAILRSSDDD